MEAMALEASAGGPRSPGTPRLCLRTTQSAHHTFTIASYLRAILHSDTDRLELEPVTKEINDEEVLEDRRSDGSRGFGGGGWHGGGIRTG